MENIISTNYINKSDLEKLSKRQLINFLLKERAKKTVKVMIVDNKKPQPIPYSQRWNSWISPFKNQARNVKKLTETFEENIIPPPIQFRDDFKPIPAPRTKTLEKPVPLPRTKIEQTDKALKAKVT